ncbi:MAG: hypothetical protein H7Z41_09945, partial [Cytophagales bacterium]|nr:hypothetical protein [Armatimonadota bacterium]
MSNRHKVSAAAAVFLSAAGPVPAAAQKTPLPSPAPPPSSGGTYPDESGFEQRVRGMIEQFAKRPVGQKCLAFSACPDTGLPVRTFSVQGEEVVSPYTGRRYVQGDTGYFGPKARGADGRITAFGGDPLKQDLPPAIARLLRDPGDIEVKAFLSVPGSLRQQYHFAATNWARFYPLLADNVMGAEWEAQFKAAIAVYTESRRPSDGLARENLPISTPHDLIGEPGELLGGNVKDGGTENHKTMWRTSGLLYAQWFGPEARISGVPAAEAERRITPMLTGFLRTILTVGNGEYESSTYYPYSLRAYLNLHDFSPKPQTRALARTMLDYYLATYALKCVNGVHAGAEKRGWAGDGDQLGEMDAHLYVWGSPTTIPVETASLVTSIHQATTAYRPNRILHHLLTRKIALPFEAQMARP